MNYMETEKFLLNKVMTLYNMNHIKPNATFFLRLMGWYFPPESQTISCYFCGQSCPLSDFNTTNDLIQTAEKED